MIRKDDQNPQKKKGLFLQEFQDCLEDISLEEKHQGAVMIKDQCESREV